MAFTSGINSLVTPAGTLTFNDATAPRLLVLSLTGMDNASVRASVDNAPQTDLAIVHNALSGARYPGIKVLLQGSDANGVATYEDEIKGYVGSIMRADGKLLFTPPGQAQRYITVRAYDQVEFEPLQTGSFGEPLGFYKTGTIPLVAGNPYAYGNTQDSTDITDGGSTVITNTGNAPDYPVLRVYGPFTGFTITNNTLGESIAMGNANPMSVASGHYVEIITSLETCILDGSGQHLEGYLDVASTDFWPIAADPDAAGGANTIAASFIAPGGATKVTVLSNDAWR